VTLPVSIRDTRAVAPEVTSITIPERLPSRGVRLFELRPDVPRDDDAAADPRPVSIRDLTFDKSTLAFKVDDGA
jgi:hypothetical protein